MTSLASIDCLDYEGAVTLVARYRNKISTPEPNKIASTSSSNEDSIEYKKRKKKAKNDKKSKKHNKSKKGHKRSYSSDSHQTRKVSKSSKRRNHRSRSKDSHKRDTNSKPNTKNPKSVDLITIEKEAKALMNEIISIEGALKNPIQINPIEPTVSVPTNEIERIKQEKDAFTKKKKEERELRELEVKVKEANKAAEDAIRDDLTVLVHNIPMKATEMDIYKLFSDSNAGRIRDIRVIKDPKSNKSKGAAYVEFYTSESVLIALGLSGIIYNGSTIKVYPSQAEKNRAHLASKTLKSSGGDISMLATPPAMVYIDGIKEELKLMTEEDLKFLFSNFGEIQRVSIERNDNGETKGFGSIQFKNLKEARKAVEIMHGFYINSQKISVSLQPITAIQAEYVKKQIDFDGVVEVSKGQKLEISQRLNRQSKIEQEETPALSIPSPDISVQIPKILPQIPMTINPIQAIIPNKLIPKLTLPSTNFPN